MCSTRCAMVSPSPITMVAVLSMPMEWAHSITWSQSSVMIFLGLTFWRISSTRISAPPPGRLSSPAACNLFKQSNMDMPA